MNKTTNLLPPWAKDKMINAYLVKLLCLLGAVLVMVSIFMYWRVIYYRASISELKKGNDLYNAEKLKMEDIRLQIQDSRDILSCFQNSYFPFVQFMKDLQDIRPEGLIVISADSYDKLATTSKQEQQIEGEAQNEETKNSEQSQGSGDTKTEEQKNQTKPENQAGTEFTGYTKDLIHQPIIIRGYSQRQDVISQYICDISKLPYIVNTTVTAIEQHQLDDAFVNIFEIVVIGGINEADNSR